MRPTVRDRDTAADHPAPPKWPRGHPPSHRVGARPDAHALCCGTSDEIVRQSIRAT